MPHLQCSGPGCPGSSSFSSSLQNLCKTCKYTIPGHSIKGNNTNNNLIIKDKEYRTPPEDAEKDRVSEIKEINYWQAWNVWNEGICMIGGKKGRETHSFINPSPRLSAINQSQHYSALTSDPCCSFISTWWASLWGHHTLHEAVYECLWQILCVFLWLNSLYKKAVLFS